jgi:hypothetical protein
MKLRNHHGVEARLRSRRLAYQPQKGLSGYYEPGSQNPHKGAYGTTRNGKRKGSTKHAA